MPTARSQATSLAVHAMAIALLLFLSSHSFFTVPAPPTKPQTREPVLLAPVKLIRVDVAARGGGSNTSPEQARQGVPPPRATHTFVPPELRTNPQIAIPVTIDFDVPGIEVVSNQPIGDPFSKFKTGGLGKDGGNTIGNARDGRRIGEEPGFDSSGRFGTPTTPAKVIYQVDPEFSEDARKAKFQGTVVMMIDIGVDGRAHNPKIVQNPGLGLDAKAVEAVAQWRFRPALRGKTPVTSTARVEVYFHLL